MPKIVSFTEARRNGLLRYFTGKPCRHGHIAERQTSNGCCLECHRSRAYKYNRVRDDERINRKYSEHRHHEHWPAFWYQRRAAEVRGIDWQLTFPEWLAIWKKSRRLPKRGRKIGNFVMARHGDAGPYSPENVSIVSSSKNCREAYQTRVNRQSCRS